MRTLVEGALRHRRSVPMPEPGSFYWCVARLDLGDPTLTMIARGVCWCWTIWPEQLLGYERAGEAVSCPGNPPLSGATDRALHVVNGRHACWALARELTDLTAAEIGEAFGGHTASAVTAYWRRPCFLTAGDLLELHVEDDDG